MKNVLMILQPREIPIAVNSLGPLPIDKVWFRAFIEPEIEEPMAKFINETSYDNYILISDDVTVKPSSLEAIEKALVDWTVVTGWCRVDDTSQFANVTKEPLRLPDDADWPANEDYTFYSVEQVKKMPLYFRTWFVGWALSGFRRDVWLRFPFEANPYTESQSDWQTSWRMQKADVPITAVRDAYIEHLRKEPNPLTDHWLVDKEPGKVIFQGKGESFKPLPVPVATTTTPPPKRRVRLQPG